MTVENKYYTPIRFVKTEIIDVNRTNEDGSALDPQAINRNFDERQSSVFTKYDHLILKPLPTSISRGLKNLGETCYMNSVLQCLANLESFYYLLTTETAFVDMEGFSVLNFLKKLLPKMFEDEQQLLVAESLNKNISCVNKRFLPCTRLLLSQAAGRDEFPPVFGEDGGRGGEDDWT